MKDADLHYGAARRRGRSFPPHRSASSRCRVPVGRGRPPAARNSSIRPAPRGRRIPPDLPASSATRIVPFFMCSNTPGRSIRSVEKNFNSMAKARFISRTRASASDGAAFRKCNSFSAIADNLIIDERIIRIVQKTQWTLIERHAPSLARCTPVVPGIFRSRSYRTAPRDAPAPRQRGPYFHKSLVKCPGGNSEYPYRVGLGVAGAGVGVGQGAPFF